MCIYVFWCLNHTHTHTRTHTHTHTHTHMHTHTTCTLTPHTHTPHAHTYTHTHTHLHLLTHLLPSLWLWSFLSWARAVCLVCLLLLLEGGGGWGLFHWWYCYRLKGTVFEYPFCPVHHWLARLPPLSFAGVSEPTALRGQDPQAHWGSSLSHPPAPLPHPQRAARAGHHWWRNDQTQPQKQVSDWSILC